MTSSESRHLRTRSLHLGVALTIICWAFGSIGAVAQSGVLFGVEGVGSRTILGTLDRGSGVFAAIGGTGVEVLDLAYDPALDTLYGCGRVFDPFAPGIVSNRLYVLDQTSGVARLVGEILVGFEEIHGLAFDTSTGTLFGSGCDRLYSIDPATANGTLVGTTGIHCAFSLTYDPVRDVLYAGTYGSPGGGIRQIDKNSAVASRLPVELPSSYQWRACFDTDLGVLWGTEFRNQPGPAGYAFLRYRIDLDAGDARFVGLSQTTAQGMAYKPSGASGEFQVNQDGAALTVNGASNTPHRAVEVTVVTGRMNEVCLASTNTRMPWQIGVIMEPAVPGSLGGVTAAGGQFINVNLNSPSLALVNPQLIPFAPVRVSMVRTLAGVLSAQLMVADPALPDGAALSAALEITAIDATNPEGFDTLIAGGGVYAPGWRDGGGSKSWVVHSGGQTQSGPVLGASSLPNYIWCIVSSFPAPIETYRINTCEFITAGLPSPRLEFSLSRIGPDIGTLVVRQDDGTGTYPMTLAVYTGPEPSGTDWTRESLPIARLGGVGAFQFDYTNAGALGRLAIDDVTVR